PSRVELTGKLSGRRIVLTAQRRAEHLASALQRHGASIVHAPTLSVIPHIDDPELIARTRALIEHRPDIVVVTTGVGFTGWGEVAEAAGLREEWHEMLTGARIIARGPKARGAIQAAGLVPEWVAESETSAEIEEALLGEGVRYLRIAVQHHGAGADGLDESFAAAGADVCSLVVYRWTSAPDPEAVVAAVRSVAERRCDAVAFTSAPGAAAFLEAAADEDLLPQVIDAFTDDDGGVLAAAVGSVTARPLQEKGITPGIPERFRLGAVARILIRGLETAQPSRVDDCRLHPQSRPQAGAPLAVCQERHRGTSSECGRNVSETSSRYSDRMTVTPSTTAGAPRTEGMNFYTRKWVRPEDLNANGTLFGGSLLRWIDEEAAIYAIIQLGNHRVVTKLISEIDFRASA